MTKITFLFSAICVAFYIALIFKKEAIKSKKLFLIISFCFEIGLAFLFAISFIYEKILYLRFLYLVILFLGIIQILFVNFNAFNKPFVKFLVKSIAVICVIEAFVFNFNSFHLLFGDYKESILNLSDAELENLDSRGENESDGEILIEYKDINSPIGTISIDASSSKYVSLEAEIDIKDETYSADYRYSIAKISIIDNNNRSQTIPCHFSGSISSLRIRFNAEEGEKIQVNSIEINKGIVWKFSFERFFSLLSITVFLKLILSKKLYKMNVSNNENIAKPIFNIITITFVLIALALTLTYRMGLEQSLIADFTSKNGNQITKEIVDAFENGEVKLQFSPDDKLLSLENPYDLSQRKGINYAWDHVLYEGKYYSYYGIAPVLLLFLPYHMLTGYYFPSVWAVFLFGILGIIFLSKFFYAFVKKFFPSTSLTLITLCLISLQVISGIWFCFNVPNFYEIAQTSGFACIMIGAYFLITSNVIGDGKISNRRLCFSTIFLSLSVLCRPTLAIYCVTSLIIIFAGYFKIKQSDMDNKISWYKRFFASAFVPFIVIGSIQMIYNYLRFGSIIDFGIQYSLTINDFTNAEYHHHFAGIGFFNYLFAFPTFSEEFPFFASSVKTFSPNGYYFVATNTAIGLVWRFLPLCVYPLFKKAYSYSESKSKKLYTAIILANCIIAPFIIIFSIWESGYGMRYVVDFGWQLVLGAMIIMFILFQKAGNQLKYFVTRLLAVSVIIGFVLSFAQVYNWVFDNAQYSDLMEMMLSFNRVFEFWR